MIPKIIEFSVRNRFIVFILVAGVSLWGVYCLYRTPVDAIPDLSENQVIVWADWMGRSPQEIEDQVTYPLSVNLQGLAGVKSIRATSEFGFSMINIIFDEHIEFYFARQRVLERLSIAGSFLPPGVVPYLAPDATALGQIFWYTVEGEGRSLGELRTIQDWHVRYPINSVPGVAQVSSVGGFVREYQVDVDPEKLRAFDLSLGQVFGAVMASNSSVGGKVIHKGGAEYLVRGYGWIRDVDDIKKIAIEERNGVPITVERIATVQLGPAFRRSVLEKDGREAVGGVVMMRYGENPLEVTRRIKEKIGQLQAGLPAGVRIVPFYDRTGLIQASIDTLTHTLIEEILIATLVVLLILWHFRSAIVICVTLPLAVLIAFIFMYYLEIPSNIMSLSGIAISIGVLVDAGIVMAENAYHRLHDHFPGGRVTGDTREIVIESCKVVGGPLFFSILIMLLSFAPIFVLGGIEGKMFNPLAYTKTFALAGVAVLAITLVPALIPTFIRGKLHGQDDVWLVRSFVAIYRPMLSFFLKHPDVIVVITGTFLLIGLPIFPHKFPWIVFIVAVPFVVATSIAVVARHRIVCLAILFCVAATAYRTFTPLGEEFMPPLDELAIMDMPVTTPNVNITQAGDDIKERDRVLRSFPEVHQVVGKVGRAETPTDPSPIDMVETVVSLRPKSWWPKRKINYDDALAEARGAVGVLVSRGILKPVPDSDIGEIANSATMEAVVKFDRAYRDLSMRRFHEYVPMAGRALVTRVREEVVGLLRRKGALKSEIPAARWIAFDDRLTAKYAPEFREWVLRERVAEAVQEVVDFLVAEGAVAAASDLLAEPKTFESEARDLLRTISGVERPTLAARIQERLVEEQDALMVERVRQLNWEIEDRAPGAMVWFLLDEAVAVARAQGLLAREPAADELHGIRSEREGAFHQRIFLWPKLKSDLVKEMDSELQVPGWGNIWTQPIINRVDMLATGVRTMIGVKVFGDHLDRIQTVSNEIAAALRQIRGAVDVFPDQIVGENYLEIGINREKAARYGVSVEAIQDVIEVALGGKDITMTVEGRERYPVRVRYPRDWREDEESVGNLLVPAAGGGMEAPPSPSTNGGRGGGSSGGGMGARSAARVTPSSTLDPGPGTTDSPSRLRQVPLSLVADIRIVPGPSMIKSENGLLRAYVQLNVRERDIVGFVEEAQRVVDAQVKLPPGFHLEWSGQFEHQVRAQKTLMIVLPMVILIIFVILYMTYKDFADTLMMFLAVPGAVAGGALFQYMWGYNISVAVWVGYVVCFGLATETAIVMLVYLREAVDRRGGLEAIAKLPDPVGTIREVVMEGAVHRLRPKLLTEGTTVLALIPMLWATGVGAEYMRPMAVPILGGILIADEVIDIFIPVLFYWERRRRLKGMQKAEVAAAPVAAEA
ncbi:MAG: efflux RND transporter permease subunit [Planctomycetes bacterium]|nr:efflux RND transporter permease subunit [Planctomycetota bacterium]